MSKKEAADSQFTAESTATLQKNGPLVVARGNKGKRAKVSTDTQECRNSDSKRLIISNYLGFEITVENCEQRIFKDQEFADVGCKMVEKGTWKQAPEDAYIIGLKELPEGDFSPLKHKHIMFAHCYKNQDGWAPVLNRWVQGKGLLLDLEFLMLNGRRVAAFGYYAGFAGCAVGLDVWAHQILNPGE